jgi:phytoene dehydrogenase-like protein
VSAPAVVVIGAGLNGLVAATYLARAGHAPIVLERRPAVGGSVVNDEFYPGFRGPILAHAGGPLRASIAGELDLDRQGLRTVRPDPYVVLPSLGGRVLALAQNAARPGGDLGMWETDARRYQEFCGAMARATALIDPFLRKAPPSLENAGARDIWDLLVAGRTFRSAGRAEASRMLRWMTMPAADLVGEWFEDELLRAVVVAPALLGAFAAPRSPGTGALILLHAAVHGHPGGPGTFHPGGQGLLTQALASAARAAGADIRTSESVIRVDVKGGRVANVVLASGRIIPARAVVSNADPRRTLLDLVDPGELDPAFRERVRQYRCRGVTAKLNLALSGLPRFTAIRARRGSGADAGERAWMMGRIQIGPSLDYLERAFDAVKYGEYSEEPYLDVTIPSLIDPSLAPSGCHVMSICAQFAPYRLKAGSWETERERYGDVVMQTLEAHAPGLSSLVVGRQILTPSDLDSDYGLTGGHIYHGEPAADQLFAMRPFYGWSRYRTPIAGLYLCGAGTHPGIGMSGDSGANAAREVVQELRR